MKRITIIIFTVFYNIICIAQNENLKNDAILNYIEKYKNLAIEEQQRVGIPAAITIAQGIHESAASTSELAINANNHFGIKCKKDWTGETYLHDDDAVQECFRKYSSDKDSYLDHSNYLKNNRRYAFLFDIPVANYQEWAVGLRKAGYATNPKYSTRIIDLIEKYHLQEYTLLGTAKGTEVIATKEINGEENKLETEISTPKKSNTKKVKKQEETLDDNTNSIEEMLNGLRGFYAKKGDLLLKEAMDRNIKYSKLLELNDLDESPLPCNMFIYTEKKYKRSPLKKNHIVVEGETMQSIAQQEGLQLKALYNLNLMEDGEEPATGSRIYLQSESSRKPLLKKKDVEVTATKLQDNINNKKTDDVNIAGEILKENNQDDNTKKIIPKVESEIKTTIPIVETTINLDSIENAKKEEIEKVRIAAQLQEQNKIQQLEKEKQDAIAKEELAKVEAVKLSATLENKNAEVKEPEIVVIKSPSNYKETGVSDELHKMKKIMDEIVYAVPPKPLPVAVKKEEKIITPVKKTESAKVEIKKTDKKIVEKSKAIVEKKGNKEVSKNVVIEKKADVKNTINKKNEKKVDAKEIVNTKKTKILATQKTKTNDKFIGPTFPENQEKSNAKPTVKTKSKLPIEKNNDKKLNAIKKEVAKILPPKKKEINKVVPKKTTDKKVSKSKSEEEEN